MKLFEGASNAGRRKILKAGALLVALPYTQASATVAPRSFLPPVTDVARYIAAAEPSYWGSRASSFATLLWPVMEYQAREAKAPLDWDVFSKMSCLGELSRFVARHSHRPEGAAMARFLGLLPGESVMARETQLGFLTMQIARGIECVRPGMRPA